MTKCEKHRKDDNAQDLKRIEENAWKVDPPKKKFQRSPAIVARNREKAAQRHREKQSRIKGTQFDSIGPN